MQLKKECPHGVAAPHGQEKKKGHKAMSKRILTHLIEAIQVMLFGLLMVCLLALLLDMISDFAFLGGAAVWFAVSLGLELIRTEVSR